MPKTVGPGAGDHRVLDARVAQRLERRVDRGAEARAAGSRSLTYSNSPRADALGRGLELLVRRAACRGASNAR